ncbi:hypothetical protein EVAR_99136_1 [Eumeta japonica]|uniref:Uncharacterized protein n=1 Tax=Eumeta variegata TaxID=151549 RepID=A0A4C1SU61_EUMVA|nr:hypothetical protein EVAR_99136_1 [Eumeta japonica]
MTPPGMERFLAKTRFLKRRPLSFGEWRGITVPNNNLHGRAKMCSPKLEARSAKLEGGRYLVSLRQADVGTTTEQVGKHP